MQRICKAAIFLLVQLCVMSVILNTASASTEFFVEPVFHLSSFSKISASLKLESQHAYFYVEDNYYNSLSPGAKGNFNVVLNNLAEEFDNRIYPTERQIFGEEWSPGIDADTKITILLSNMKTEQGGYFRIEDEYSRAFYSDSNEREMVYINASKLSHPFINSYLAHEFQHLITFNQKTKQHGLKEEVWLDEARSEYATTLLGYNQNWQDSYLQKRVKDFLAQPSTSLTKWKGTSPDFGVSFVFIHFLVDHYGERILILMTQNNKTGIDSIDSALKALGKPETFNDVFTDWTIANYINNILPVYGNKYAYSNSNLFYGYLHVQPDASYNIFQNQGIEGNFSIKDWSAKWLRFVPGSLRDVQSDILKIEFVGSGTESNFITPYIINKFSGESEIRYLSLSNNAGIDSISGFGKTISSIVLIPSTQFKRADFGSNEPQVTFSINVSLQRGNSSNPVIYDGATLRVRNDPKVFVIKDGYKRWIQSPDIFNHYGHLSWQRIIEVSQQTLNQYSESFLVRKAGDFKVYEVDEWGIKHWLNMSAVQFENSGRKWDGIYEINEYEFEWYRIGLDVLQ